MRKILVYNIKQSRKERISSAVSILVGELVLVILLLTTEYKIFCLLAIVFGILVAIGNLIPERIYKLLYRKDPVVTENNDESKE